MTKELDDKLIRFAKYGNVAVVENTLKLGAHLGVLEENVLQSILDSVVKDGDIERYSFWIQTCVSQNHQAAIRWTKLHQAVWESNIAVVAQEATPEALKASDLFGWLPLHLACWVGNMDVVRLLINGTIDVLEKHHRTPLHIALFRHHRKLVNFLLENGANPNAKTLFGLTPFAFAVYCGEKDIVEQCLKMPIDYTAVADGGWTLLHCAAFGGMKSIVLDLLSQAADLLLTTSDGMTPLLAAAKGGHTEIVAILLKHVSAGKATNSQGMTALHFAVQNGCIDMISLLLANEAVIEQGDNNQCSPLYLAAKSGKLEVVKQLHLSGANLEAKDKDQNTPLHAACSSGHREVVSYLLTAGTHVSAKNTLGWTALHYASQKGDVAVVSLLLSYQANTAQLTEKHESPLYLAAIAGHLDIVQLLHAHGAHFNTPDGIDLLLEVAKYRHTPIAEWLLTKGAKLEAMDWPCGLSWDEVSAETALHIAVRKDNVPMVEMLLKAGARVDAVTMRKETPLHYAATVGNVTLIKLLLSHGAHADGNAHAPDPDDSCRQTPLFWAVRSSNVDAVNTLLAAGAKADYSDFGTTPFHVCVKNEEHNKDPDKSAAILKALLATPEKNSALQKKDSRRFTPLAMAVSSYFRYREMVSVFLQSDPDFPIDEQAWKNSFDDEELKGILANHLIKQAVPCCVALQQGIRQRIILFPQDVVNHLYGMFYPLKAAESPTGWTQNHFKTGVAKKLSFFRAQLNTDESLNNAQNDSPQMTH